MGERRTRRDHETDRWADEGDTMRSMRRGTVTALAATVAGTLLLGGCGALGSIGSAAPATSLGGGATPSSEPPAPSATEPTDPTEQPTTATAAPTQEPTPSATTKPTPRPTPKPTPTVKPTPKEGDTLHVGDSGPYVREVQERLGGLGYWNGTPDGQYGQLTAQAVMALQKAAGLGRDGVYGPGTRRALQAGIRPQSRIGGSGIEIDKARQLLLVVRDGRVVTTLNTSTGNNQAYSYQGNSRIATTPSGSYSTFRVVDKLDKGPLGDLWRPRYFNGGIAVHGSGSIPGYPASHGCARVSNGAMNMIWATGLMPIGGRVVVY